ncbi:MAG: DUF3299 domain-containing protein [Halioglobus sp.]|jgi:hypothetical protein|nr:DUF3299 domain-containing protein [Halioglobus sp.]
MHYTLSLAMTCLFTALVLLPSSGISAPARAENNEQETFTTIEWPDLIPPETLEVLMNPPQYITEMEDGSAEDQIANNIKNAIAAASDDPYQQALSSTEVNAEMDGAMVRLPGFVVPLEFDDEQVITQFFLVPYFGACLHMPPPPPNQIILVDSPQGLTLDELYTPVWISGVLSATVTQYDMATAAYALTMAAYENYEE